MFSKFNKQIDTIFLDINSSSFETSEHVNVILSPSLYWVKKVSLPVKYLRDVKALLPSLFEDILPHGNYSYSAYKSGEEFYIFAYEDKLILDTLHNKGITTAQVHNIYFSQREIFDIHGAIQIDETQSLYKKDDILLLVPSAWTTSHTKLFRTLDKIVLSKNSIALKQFSHLVNEKSLYALASVAVIFLILIASEYFITLEKISKVESLKEKVFAKAGLKATMFQNKSMLKEYQQTDKIQKTVRKRMVNILNIPLKNDTKILDLSLRGKTIKVAFEPISDGVKSTIFNDLKSKNIKFKSSLESTILYVEIEL
ncbi:MAG: hypothetical protein QM497_01585 [Sulfurimonas sp.]